LNEENEAVVMSASVTVIPFCINSRFAVARFGGNSRYFNPQREFVCERYGRRLAAVDSDPARTDSREVLEYAKTPGGRWFAKQIRKVDYGGRETILIVNFKDDRRRIDSKLLDASRISARELVPYHRH
jgi:hypothetical protein